VCTARVLGATLEPPFVSDDYAAPVCGGGSAPNHVAAVDKADLTSAEDNEGNSNGAI
jgi:hypothetical protein